MGRGFMGTNCLREEVLVFCEVGGLGWVWDGGGESVRSWLLCVCGRILRRRWVELCDSKEDGS
jgi:hypothetical protein